MAYQNPEIPDDINISKEHPLKDFAAMLITVSLAVIAAIALLYFLAAWMVRFIPFEMEKRLAENAWQSFTQSDTNTAPPKAKHQQIENYLQQLANTMAVRQDLPENMSVTVHYVEESTVNAFATLGGHIVIYQGLLNKLSSENALAMVVAHEVAHIKHRDPIVGMGRGIVIGLAVASLAGFGDSTVAQSILGRLNFLTGMAFSRDQEDAADQVALQALYRHYGHAGDAERLFEVLQDEHSFEPPALLSSHPVNEDRIEKIKIFQQQHGGTQQPLTALPEFISE